MRQSESEGSDSDDRQEEAEGEYSREGHHGVKQSVYHLTLHLNLPVPTSSLDFNLSRWKFHVSKTKTLITAIKKFQLVNPGK